MPVFTVRQRSRKLWQVLHPHAACADPPRSAGHRQHRPERVCRLLLHKPSVHPPVSAQRRMRRLRAEERDKNTESMDCRWPQDPSKRPAVNRPTSFSAVFCLLTIHIREQKWLESGARCDNKMCAALTFLHNVPQLLVIFCVPTLFYFSLPPPKKPSSLVCTNVSGSVTNSLAMNDARCSSRLTQCCPILPCNKLQCTTRTEHVSSALSRLYLLLKLYTAYFIFIYYKEKEKKKYRSSILLHECQSGSGKKNMSL